MTTMPVSHASSASHASVASRQDLNPPGDRTPVPYHNALYRLFQQVRQEQASHHGRNLTTVNNQAARVVFETGVRAAMDVHSWEQDDNHPHPVMRVASLATGSGKSTSATALVAAYCRLYDDRSLPRDDFSAAFVVPTAQLARETVAELSRLMPDTGETIALWSSQEDTVDGDREKLGEHRVVVYCHEAWRRAMVAKRSDGLRFYKGKRRKLVFVDEQPELVQHVHVHPKHIQGFYEDVRATCPDHPIGSVLAQVVSRMNGLLGSTGQRFSPVLSLLSKPEGQLFSQLRLSDLAAFTQPELTGELKDARRATLEQLKDFLVAASRGGCFYSRQTMLFTAFKFDFDPGPGHVLLDATADLSGLTQLRPDIAHVAVPAISYRNLDAVLVTIPRRWRRVKDLLTKLERREAVEFGDWVRGVIVQHTAQGDGVLMFAKLALYQADILSKAPDPAAPYDLQGRKVNTEHHGTGIGRKVWKHKNVVAIVGHHFLPRHVTVATLHGWSGDKLTSTRLKKAEGRREYGDVFKPDGNYGVVHEGHALRWMKQESMRGNAREITHGGECGRMKVIIFTSDPNMVLRHWSSLYPGAPLPTSHEQVTGKDASRCGTAAKQRAISGYAGLAAFLRSFEGSTIDGLSIAQGFGIPGRNLPIALRSPACSTIAETFGWSVVKAKRINKPGRGNWLVNWKRYATEVGQANLQLVSQQSGLSAG